MKKEWMEPKIEKLNVKETLGPRHYPTAWDCYSPEHPYGKPETTASYVADLGCFKCDFCSGNEKNGYLVWVGNGPHGS